MTVAIRQEINLTNVTADPVDNVEALFGGGGYIKFDSSDFNGATFYVEIVAKNSDSSAHDLIVYESDDAGDHAASVILVTLSIPANTTSWTLIRSSSVTPNNLYLYKFYTVAAAIDTYISIKSAKIIILQSATDITDTQTQIEVGQYGMIVPADKLIWYPIPEPKYWKYESAKWDPTPTFKFAFTMGIEDDKETYIIGLEEASDAAFTSDVLRITDSQVTVTSEPAAYYESSAFTPTDGYYYRIVYHSDDDKGDEMYWYNAKVIATQLAYEIRVVEDEVGPWLIQGVSAGESYQKVGQSFTTVGAVSVSEIWVKMDKTGSPTDNLNCMITSALAGDTPITNGTSDAVSGSGLSTDYEWVKFNFSTPPSLSGTTKYYAKIYRSGSRDATNYYGVVLDTSTEYNGGYAIQVTTGDSWVESEVNGSHFLIRATDSVITKLQPEYLMINDAQDDTGLQEFLTDFDPAEWDGVDNTYYHEHSADASGSNTKLVQDPGGTPADIANSSITGANLQRGELSVLEEQDSDYQASGDYLDVIGYGSFIHVSCSADGLKSYSVDSLGNLTYEDDIDNAGTYYGLWADNNWVYAAAHGSGVRIYSVDVNGNYTLEDSDFQSGDDYRGVWGDGSIVVAACGSSGLRSYTIDGSGNLTYVGVHFQNGTYHRVWGDGTWIYVSCLTGGVQIYSIDGSGNLTYKDTSSYDAITVWHNGSYLCVAGGSDGALTYSIDGSGNILHRDTLSLGGYTTGVFGYGGFVYFISPSRLNRCIIEDDGDITLIDVLSVGSNADKLYHDGLFSYVTFGAIGLKSYKSILTLPATAKEIDSYIVTA